MGYSYWKNQKEFDAQSDLLQNLFDQQGDGYPQIITDVSMGTLAERQRDRLIGCIYFAGGRVDNKFGLGSRNVGILHSALPTDYVKAIAPAFHGDHDELIVCTDGRVVIEYSSSRSEDAGVNIVTLAPGEYFIVRCGFPHRISLAPLRMIANKQGERITVDEQRLGQVQASFLAVKMGILAGKSPDEDMSKSSPGHPLTKNWNEDEAFLNELRKDQNNCERLNIPRIRD